jgi:cytidylate kinase
MYVDTGAMYRVATLILVESGAEREKIDEDSLARRVEKTKLELVRDNTEGMTTKVGVLLDGREVKDLLRTKEIDALVARVATLPAVRKVLVQKQREMVEGKSVVMEGRDIGTVVLPRANLKVYLDADLEIRVKRRYDELVGKGMNPTYESLWRRIDERDRVDKCRQDSPLRPAEDAWSIDTGDFTIDQVVEMIVKKAKQLGGINA